MFAALAAGYILLTIFTYSQNIEQTLWNLPPGANATDREVVANQLRAELPVRCAFLPFRLLIGWAAISLVLFNVCKSFAPAGIIRFRQVFAIQIAAEMIPLLGSFGAAVYALATDSPHFETIPFNLTAIIDPHRSAVLHTLLGSFNLVQLFYVAFLGYGISRLCNFGKAKAMLIVLSVWAVSIWCNALMMQYVAQEMHLPL